MEKTAQTYTNRKKYFLYGSVITLLTIVCLVSFSIQLITIKKDTPSAVYGIDFIAYYTAAQLIREGEIYEIYVEIDDDFSVVGTGNFFETARKSGFHLTPTRYVYLPLFLTPFTLFTKFSFPTAATLWLILNLCAVIAVILLEWSFTKELPHPILRLMAIISLNLCSFPLFYALKLGQTSIMVYLALCFIYYFTLKKQDCLAGIFLGMITALKFSPLLFILYFLYRKRYTLVISSILTVLFILSTSLITYGLPLHKIYWNYLSELSGLEIAAWSNQSIDAFLLRLFTKIGILHFYPVKAITLVFIIRYALTLFLIGILYFCLKGKKSLHSKRLYPLEFSAIILCFLIIPTISWLHYFTLVTLSTVLIVTVLFQIYPNRIWTIIPIILISYGMIATHLNYASLIATFGQGYFTRLITSLPLIGTCLILFINLFLIKLSRTAFPNNRFH